ncbi:mitochondrial ribosomal protein [Niveomyces insectorum RCEF 264]|uniref:Large ribosomal subunit protein uL23m n=1 Tax=Niveomyces insectorum RCEF 264 TaxID=1081102 RepID=A0A167NB18_9HYPO|nr:mitochondrial ribosomal protein [Niveomyces insectorum RCEF 264]
MATKVAAAAKDAAANLKPNFRVGGTKVYLPDHLVRMLPPRRILSPQFATFQVPLRFNKLDLRDYLFHAYGVPVRAVRAWITPQRPRRRYGGDVNPSGDAADPDNAPYTKDIVRFGRGQWYRPQPIKRMMVELLEPFVYPAPPPATTTTTTTTAGSDGAGDGAGDEQPRKAWDYALHERLAAGQRLQDANQRRQAHEKKFRMRSEEDHVPAFRVALARQARELVRGERTWQPGMPTGSDLGGGGGGSGGSGDGAQTTDGQPKSGGQS